MENASHGGWYYEQIDLGYNYRMTDIQAALGSSQLKRLDSFIAKRHQIAKRYNESFKDLPVDAPFQGKNQYSAYHLYVITLHNPNLRKKLFDFMRENKVLVNVHYIPIHTQPYYQKLGFKWGDFPNSEKYYQSAISLPMFYDLSDEDQGRVIELLKTFFNNEQ